MKLTPGIQAARFSPDMPPLLLVVIDTEEEFDWSAPFNRESRSVTCIEEQHHAQRVFEAHNLVPTYVVDYPVATTPSSYAIFREWLTAGRCLVGAHLHPWVNPPDEEEVSAPNSYPGNLPADLEREKLARLTEAITANIGQRPIIYKAGRYGLGPHTAAALEALGYEIDLSVLASTDLGEDGGPDFRGYPMEPYWFGSDGGLFEVPLTRGYPGMLGPLAEPLYQRICGPLGRKLHLPGIAARLGLAERIHLTPEGISLEDNKRLIRYLVAKGQKVFTYAYHSSSLLPGGSPYVKTREDRASFVESIDSFLRFFQREIGGRWTTPLEIRSLASDPR